MGKQVQVRAGEQFDVSAWDYEIEVVKTRAAWERWKGITLTWRSATVELGRRIWVAHKALDADSKGGRPKTVRAGQKTVRAGHTVTEFITGVGMARSTFYDFIKRMDEMMDAGINLLELPADMKLVEAAAPKSQAEVELEEKIAKQETAIKNRDRTLTEFKEDLNKEHNKLETSRKTIRELKKEANKQSEPDPELLKRIENLQKQEENLTDQVDWYSTAAAFKTELQALLNTFDRVSSLGKRVLQTKKPIS